MTNLQHREDSRVGDVLLELQTDTSWVLRRVERISFEDLSRVELRTSVDIDLQALREVVRAAGFTVQDGFLVPLAFFQKELLLDFDVQSNDGASLQLLSSDQNSIHTVALLCAYLRAVGTRESEISSIRPALQRIAGLETYSEELISEEEVRDAALASVMKQFLNENEFLDFLKLFSSNYMALVKIPDPGTETATLKYRVIQDSDEWRPAWYVRWGFQFPIMTHSGLIGQARSNHQILEAPAGLSIGGALTATQPAATVDEDRQEVHRGLPEIRQRHASKQYVVYSKSEQQLRITTALRMVPGLGEFHLPALLNMSLVLILLTCCLVLELLSDRLSELDELSPIVTILALVPSILNVYLTLPGEHPVVARLFVVPRILVYIASALTVIVATIIAVKLGPNFLLAALWVASGYAVFVWTLILWTTVRILRNSRKLRLNRKSVNPRPG